MCFLSRQEDPDQFRVLSLGQFRPEKDHPLQVRAIARLRDKVTEEMGVSQEERERRWKRVRNRDKKTILSERSRNCANGIR